MQNDMFATAFGPDGLEGDSSFMPQHLSASADDTYEVLYERWKCACAADYGYEPQNADEMIEEEDIEKPIGFWIYDDVCRRAVEAIWESDPGCDSAVHECNRISKTIMKQMSKEIRCKDA